jgi:hypothetical protein
MILSENRLAEKSFKYRRLLKTFICITAILFTTNSDLFAQLHIITQPVSAVQFEGWGYNCG